MSNKHVNSSDAVLVHQISYQFLALAGTNDTVVA